jgi:general secretion pathway protein D
VTPLTTDTTTATTPATTTAAAANALARTFPGFNWAIVANPGRLIANLHALASQGLVNVLSSPSVMVIDNQEANIEVGQEVPVQTQQQQALQAGSNILNSYEYKKVGVKLKVKPRVTPGGLVQMGIFQEVSNKVASDTPNNPTFGLRQITSTVAVRSNQAVVLGGLIEDSRSDAKSGIPGLYDVPVAGPLFGTRGKGSKRTELIVILIPKVIASDQDIESVNNDFRDRMRGLQFKF